jgi:hypothetical protein
MAAYCYYQSQWDLLGTSITSAVLDFSNGGVLPEDLNRITIVLIPKTRNPPEMKEFRPNLSVQCAV